MRDRSKWGTENVCTPISPIREHLGGQQRTPAKMKLYKGRYQPMQKMTDYTTKTAASLGFTPLTLPL